MVGFDDIEESRFGAITLTTVAPDKQAIARQAVNCVISRLTDAAEAEPRRLRPGHDLVVRESTLGRHQ